jgi:protein-S-isoprenylcysteine O-methyltransferase Ste14
MAALGTAIGIGRLRCFLGVAVAFVSWLVKSRTEEALLISKFGERYEEYRRHVKGLIPFVF